MLQKYLSKLISDKIFIHRVEPMMSLWLAQELAREGVAIWPSVQCGFPLIEFTMTFSLCASKRPFKLAGFVFTTLYFSSNPSLTIGLLV